MRAHHVCLLSLALVFSAGAVEARPKLASKEFSSLKKEIKRAAKTSQFGAAASKIRALGEDDSKRAIDFLCVIAKVPDAEIYNAARDAVAGMESDEAKNHILAKLKRGGGAVAKMLLVDAMGKRGDRFAGEALGIAVTAKQGSVQRAAIAAIKAKKLFHGLGGVIDLLERLEKKDSEGLNAALVRETLFKITGQSFDKAVDWRKWWDVNKQGFRPVTGKAKQPIGQTAQRKRPRFFGSEIKSNRLVFVIDVSGSMEAADAPGGGGMGRGRRRRTPTGGGAGKPPAPAGNGSRVRIERAKAQLKQVIEALPPKARFTILAYSGVLVRGPGGKPQMPGGQGKGKQKKGNDLLPPKLGGFEWLKIWRPKLMPASAKNKKDAQTFVAALKANGGTFTLNALKHAMRVSGADTIVVLSDGFPNDVDMKTGQQLSQKQILDKVAVLNRRQRRVIDTFGFDQGGGRARGGGAVPGGFGRRRRGRPRGAGMPRGGGGSLGKFMQDLAKQNGGSYTPIN